MPGLTDWLKRIFCNVALELTRPAPAPQPSTRRRTEQARVAFMPAARKIMRRAPRLAAPVYAASSFLSHTLDWLNQWQSIGAYDDMDDDFEPMHHDDIYPHL